MPYHKRVLQSSVVMYWAYFKVEDYLAGSGFPPGLISFWKRQPLEIKSEQSLIQFLVREERSVLTCHVFNS